MTRGDRLLWILLIGLLVGVLVLVAHHEQGEVAGLSLDDFGSLVAKVSVGIFIAAAAWSMLRGRIGEALTAALFWLVLASLLAVVYTYREPLLQGARRVTAELVPGYAVNVANSGDSVTVEIQRGAHGDFSVRAAVNGAGVTMLVDTGASSVVLTQEDARAAGLPLGFLTYDVPVDTANGRVRAASVLLDNLIVGGIVERQVPALVSPPGALRSSLLGMSFLRRLEAFEFRGDRLVLRGAPAS